MRYRAMWSVANVLGRLRSLAALYRRRDILIRLSTLGPLFFRPSRVLVDENGADCTAAVIGPACCVRRARASWHTREAVGRTGANDIGIRKTFARDARTGDRERMVGDIWWMQGTESSVHSTGDNSLMAESCPPYFSRALNPQVAASKLI
jgi:hypothetical protein